MRKIVVLTQDQIDMIMGILEDSVYYGIDESPEPDTILRQQIDQMKRNNQKIFRAFDEGIKIDD